MKKNTCNYVCFKSRHITCFETDRIQEMYRETKSTSVLDEIDDERVRVGVE